MIMSGRTKGNEVWQALGPSNRLYESGVVSILDELQVIEGKIEGARKRNFWLDKLTCDVYRYSHANIDGEAVHVELSKNLIYRPAVLYIHLEIDKRSPS